MGGRRPRVVAWAWAAAVVAGVSVAEAQLTLLSGPQKLLEQLGAALRLAHRRGTGASLSGRTAVLGSPYYGDRAAGALVLVELTPGSCEVATLAGKPPADFSPGGPWLGVLRPGAPSQCSTLASLVRAVRSAAADGPLASQRYTVAGLVLVDSSGGGGNGAVSPIAELEPLADPAAVATPSIWLNASQGGGSLLASLEVAVAAGGLVGGISGALTWGPPASAATTPAVVDLDLWLRPGEAAAHDFARRLAAALRPLRAQLRPLPRWPLHVRLAGKTPQSDAAHFVCTSPERLPGLQAALPLASAFQLCSHAPLQSGTAGPGSWTGEATAWEAARQKCFRHTVRNHEVYWEYLERLYGRCGDVQGANATEAELCSVAQMAALGANLPEVARCSQEHLGELLAEEATTPQPGTGPLSLRIGGWVYGGPWQVDVVVDAICASLSPSPPACGGAWRWRELRWFVAPVPLWPTGAAALLASVTAPLLLPWAWVATRRRLKRCGRRAKVQ